MNLARLAQLAEAATAGPWEATSNKVAPPFQAWVSQHDSAPPMYFGDDDAEHASIAGTFNGTDAEFIAAANPSVVAALVKLAQAAQEHIDMKPPVTASPYWSKPEGDLRAALDALGLVMGDSQ